MKRSDMHPYQEKAVQWVMDHDRCALWLDPGLGKTVTALTAMDVLMGRFEARFPLVVAPLRVSRSVWPQEAQKWEHLEHMTCCVLYWPDAGQNKEYLSQLTKKGLRPNVYDSNIEIAKKTKERNKLLYGLYMDWLKSKLATKATFYSINREQLHLLCSVVYQNWPFDLVFLDEASSFKHSSSMRFKAIKAVQNKIYRLVELTGSPCSNGLLDLWAQIYMLDGGASLLSSNKLYRETFFHQAFNGFNWDIAEGQEEVICQRIQPLVITFRAKDHLKIKEPEFILHPLQLPEKINEKYTCLERDYLVGFDEDTVTAVHNAALHNKLHQICNGAVYVDDEGEMVESDNAEKSKKQWVEVHSAKLDRLKEIVDDAKGQPILVAYNFRHDLERILKRFSEARKIDTQQDIEDWNAGKIKMGVGHPASMGHGLNLQEGGYIGIFFGYLWDRELFDQFIRRLARQGQQNSVIIHIIFIDRKVEQVMAASLAKNGVVQDRIMNFMRVP